MAIQSEHVVVKDAVVITGIDCAVVHSYHTFGRFPEFRRVLPTSFKSMKELIFF